MLHERFCAFVNFEKASMAASALEMLNVGGSTMSHIFGNKVSSGFNIYSLAWLSCYHKL